LLSRTQLLLRMQKSRKNRACKEQDVVNLDCEPLANIIPYISQMRDHINTTVPFTLP